MRVVSYNVRYFGHGTRGIASTEGGMRRIAAAVARLDPLPDVLMLQEIETRSLRSNALHWGRGAPQIELFSSVLAAELALKRTTLDSYVPHYFPAHVYGLRASPVYTTGLAILVRKSLPVLHAKAEDITQRQGYWFPSLKQTRLCAHVRVAHPRLGEIDLFNTHLSLPQAFSRQFWRRGDKMGHGKNQLAEIEALLGFIDAHRGSGGLVLAGDFNAAPGSPVIERVSSAGLRHALSDLHGLDEAGLKAFPTAGFMHLRMHIDHAFTSPELVFHELHETFPFGKREGHFWGLSDHMPLVGSVTRKGEG
ncbi:MAG TPA: endonuclease/exonuclease/phosphatase family protein [Polyangiaceae bacterium]|nr:endonuclease/exonuclease/phosphatase family protein [Polyangiaceae bacterium]